MTPRTITVKIGDPIADLPTPAATNYQAAPHWAQIASACRNNPGHWLPVTIGQLTVNRHHQIPADIRHGRLKAFRDGNFTAVYRNKQLYIRFDADASVTPIVKAAS